MPSRAGFEQHVDAMEMELPRLRTEVQHTFHPHQLLAVLLHELIDPPVEPVRVGAHRFRPARMTGPTRRVRDREWRR